MSAALIVLALAAYGLRFLSSWWLLEHAGAALWFAVTAVLRAVAVTTRPRLGAISP
ncbi:MAG: hypothetical protein ACRYHQ_28770 [Janthinobacterium lividum]